MRIYAFVSFSGEAIPVSGSLRGAKSVASRQGSSEVGYISTINNMFISTHKKINNKWIEN